MWEGSYGKEPFDLRLTVLRMLGELDIVLVFTLVGTLLFGGGYYVKNVLLHSEKQYSATSVYRVEYAVEEEKDVGTVYINQMTWNTYIHSKEFLEAVQKRLTDVSVGPDSTWAEEITPEEISGSLEAFLASDLRVPSITVTTNSEEKSLLIACAAELAMTEDFPNTVREITSIGVIDPAQAACEVVPDVRPGRAFALSAVLSCFFTVIFLLLKETGDDNIWLPATIGKRYGLKVAGTLESSELAENIGYFFGEKNSVALCTVQEQLNPNQILEELQQRCGRELAGWFASPAPGLCPESCRALREAEGILLVVRAGSHAGKQLEYCMEYLQQQDCDITAVLLYGADERLIRLYYGRKKA